MAQENKKPKKRRNGRLVLCFDGKGNKFCADESDTNVVKIYESLDRKDGNQYHYYQPGIGTFTTGSSGATFGFFDRMKQRFETILDQAIGTSFEYHVSKGHEFLMRYYKPGDYIYIFGFSEAVGEFETPFMRKSYRYIGKRAAEHIRHAVSIHEQRLKFKPNLFLYNTDDPIDLKELWFAGNHCDVGGGMKYDSNTQNHLRSDTPLAWMIDEIIALDDDPEAKLTGHETLMKAKIPTECHEETVNGRLPHDFLAYGRGAAWYTTAAWWFLEVLSLLTRLELEHGKWVPLYWPPNFGASRNLPEYAVVHPSVQSMYRARILTEIPQLERCSSLSPRQDQQS
ncbi:hypothetical protein BDV12DRAFT_186231 [Aspergillus spectabilis]